jgi:hypothetical protein
MIQRIQSIWLLLAAAAAFLTLRFSFYSGILINDTGREITPLTAQSNVLLTILTAGVGLASLIAIFLYKNRKLQLRLVLIALLVSLANIALYFMEIRKYAEGNVTLAAAFAFAVPVFLALAWRGIRKDEKLVKSLDRLR